MKSARFLPLLVLLLSCLAPPRALADGAQPYPPYIHLIQVAPSAPCATKPVSLLVQVSYGSCCGAILGARVIDPEHVALELRPGPPPGTTCDIACLTVEWRHEFPLGLLPAGDRAVTFLLTIFRDSTVDSLPAEEHFAYTLPFHVAESCDTVPPPPGLPPYVSGVQIEPEHPCSGQFVTIRVGGFFRDCCGEVLNIDPESLAVAIRPGAPAGQVCLRQCLTTAWSTSIPLGVLAAGSHQVILAYRVEDDTGVTAYRIPVSFQVSQTCDTVPGQLPYVQSIVVGYATREHPEGSVVCPYDSIPVLISGAFPNSCYSLKGIQILPQLATLHPGAPGIRIVVENRGCPNVDCLPGFYPFQAGIKLPGQPPGSQRLPVQLAEFICPDSLTSPHVSATLVPFTVLETCESIPPPPGLPYVDVVLIGSGIPCSFSNLACPGDSIPVRIFGTFPNPCFRVRRVEVVPSFLRDGALISPVIVRVVVDNGCCAAGLCPPEPTAWHASINIPPLPPGPYALAVQLAEVCCSDSIDPTHLHSAIFRFAVTESCPNFSRDCLVGGWQHPGDPGTCDASVGEHEAAQVVFGVHSGVALAGHPSSQQGESFYNEQLKGIVDDLEQKGIARESEGAKVVFFDEDPQLKATPALIQKKDGAANWAGCFARAAPQGHRRGARWGTAAAADHPDRARPARLGWHGPCGCRVPAAALRPAAEAGGGRGPHLRWRAVRLQRRRPQ